MYAPICSSHEFDLNVDAECATFKAIQLVQNKLLRLLNGTKIKDKISTKSLLLKFDMTSVNQLNAQVKLLEIWKALNLADYPLKINQQAVPEIGTTTRASHKGRPIEKGTSNLAKKASTNDAIRIWNQSPVSITESKSLYQAKNAIKAYVRTLPV